MRASRVTTTGHVVRTKVPTHTFAIMKARDSSQKKKPEKKGTETWSDYVVGRLALAA